jgi:hypothetical protein
LIHESHLSRAMVGYPAPRAIEWARPLGEDIGVLQLRSRFWGIKFR